jgi:hypothetical protein
MGSKESGADKSLLSHGGNVNILDYLSRERQIANQKGSTSSEISLFDQQQAANMNLFSSYENPN